MLHLLRQFIALSETLSFTQASRRLNLSQPALTKNIKNLEAEFGGELVSRTNRGCTLTDLGKVLYHRAKVIESEVQLMFAEMTEAVQKREKHITIGYGILWQVLYAAQIIVEVERRSEGRFVVTGRGGTTETMIENLFNGSCDIFLGQIPANLDERLCAIPLVETKHAIFVRNDHPILGEQLDSSRTTLDELTRFQWLLFGTRDDLAGYRIPEPLKEKVEVHNYHDINSLFVVIQMLQHSDSLIVLPKEVGTILALYGIRELPNHDLDMPQYDSGIIHRCDGDDDIARTVVTAVRDVLTSAIDGGTESESRAHPSLRTNA